MQRLRSLRPRLTALGLLGTSLLVACVRDEPTPPAAAPVETPVRLKGTMSFASGERAAEGTDRAGHSYSRSFAANCLFYQDAFSWKDPQTGREQFRLAESAPGIVSSESSGSAVAEGHAHTADLEHEPRLSEDSLVQLRGPVSHCRIRRLDPAQFGDGHDIELEFQVALTGTVQTSTRLDDATVEKPSAGLALPLVLAPEPTPPGETYVLVDDPANTGAHLHASPILLRPALGTRPAGAGEDVRLQQQVYDSLAAHPQTAWTGLTFDANTRTWTFTGSHVTDAGATHSLDVKIEVSR